MVGKPDQGKQHCCDVMYKKDCQQEVQAMLNNETTYVSITRNRPHEQDTNQKSNHV